MKCKLSDPRKPEIIFGVDVRSRPGQPWESACSYGDVADSESAVTFMENTWGENIWRVCVRTVTGYLASRLKKTKSSQKRGAAFWVTHSETGLLTTCFHIHVCSSLVRNGLIIAVNRTDSCSIGRSGISPNPFTAHRCFTTSLSLSNWFTVKLNMTQKRRKKISSCVSTVLWWLQIQGFFS